MDPIIVRLIIAFVIIAAALTINFRAASIPTDPPSKTKLAGLIFGGLGLLLTILVVFWPIIGILTYLAGDAEGIAKLFKPLLFGAGVCTFVSLVTLAVSASQREA